MTTKFEKKLRELDGLAMDTKTVKTRKQARELSLKKWNSLRKMTLIFWGEFNTRCGFCGLGEHKAAETEEDPHGRCRECGVKTICDEMIVKAQNLEEETLNLIDGLIAHFENMKVADT